MDDRVVGNERRYDPLREKLLEAAARVFASRGYSGVKILDVVKEAGLSIGAVYGRFDSKDDLLTEAITTRATAGMLGVAGTDMLVADLIVAIAQRSGPLSGAEAIELEAFVAARREPPVAAAIGRARDHWRQALRPTIEQAIADGTVSADADIDSILYFLEAVHLGLLILRGAGVAPRDSRRWSTFARRVTGVLNEDRDRAPARPRKKAPTKK